MARDLDSQALYSNINDELHLENGLPDTPKQNEVSSRTRGFFNSIKNALGTKNDNKTTEYIDYNIQKFYPKGSIINIPRSDGTVSRGVLIKYLPNNSMRVGFISNEKSNVKIIGEELFLSVNNTPEVLQSIKNAGSLRAVLEIIYNNNGIWCGENYISYENLRSEVDSYWAGVMKSNNLAQIPILTNKIFELREEENSEGNVREKIAAISNREELMQLLAGEGNLAGYEKSSLRRHVSHFLSTGEKINMITRRDGLREKVGEISLLKDPKREIFDAKSIDEIYEILQREEKIGKHDTKKMIQRIREYFEGNGESGFITSTYGLRNKIITLKENERIDRKITEATSKQELIQLLYENNGIGKYDARYLEKRIENYLNGLEPLKNITRSEGLRYKVATFNPSFNYEESKILHLWPYGIESLTKQGGVGNCYFVTAMNLVKKHPYGYQFLDRMITIKNNKEYEVRFGGYSQPITINTEDLYEMGEYKMETMNLGDLVLERAHARYLNIKKRMRVEPTMLADVNNRLIHEGGRIDEALKLFFGDAINTKSLYKQGGSSHFKLNLQYEEVPKESLLEFLENSLDEFNLVGLSSRQEEGKDDSNTYEVRDFNNNVINIYYSHAYSVHDFDKIQGWVDIINPHDSGNTIKINIKDIGEIFSEVTVGEIKFN